MSLYSFESGILYCCSIAAFESSNTSLLFSSSLASFDSSSSVSEIAESFLFLFFRSLFFFSLVALLSLLVFFEVASEILLLISLSSVGSGGDVTLLDLLLLASDCDLLLSVKGWEFLLCFCYFSFLKEVRMFFFFC